MNILLPFLIISVFSYYISSSYKILIAKSYLIVSFLIIYFFLFFGKFGFLNLTNEIYKGLAIILFLYFFYRKKIIKNDIKQIFLLFIVYLILIFLCKDLYYYKYDDFSEYGITTKLIFHENKLPFDIDYLQKGSHHKINFISYFHYFFLKNSSKEFYETTTFIAHSFFIILLISSIIGFLNISVLKSIIVGVIFYFLIYILGPGFDRLYVDSILGLSIGLSLLLFFHNKKSKSDLLLLFLLICSMPMMKPNGLIISIGLSGIFIIFSIFEQKKNLVFILIFAMLCNFYFTKFYTSKTFKFQTFVNNIKIFQSSENEIKQKDTRKKYFLTHDTQTFTLKTLGQVKHFSNRKLILQNKNEFFKSQFLDLSRNGIYHSKTFLIVNKLLEYSKINFKMFQIPINLFFWFLIFFLILYLISKKHRQKKLYPFIVLYSLFIISYYFILLLWAEQNQLINKDFTIEISWERHLGTLILGLIIYLLVNFIKNFQNYSMIFIILLIAVNIAPANSIRIFLPTEIINKDKFWNSNFNKRIKIKNFSKKISDEIGDYANVIFIAKNNIDPYFYPILKYELIKCNIINTNSDNLTYYLNHFKFKNSKLYVITHKDDNKVYLGKIFKKINSKDNINLAKKISIGEYNLFEILY